MERTHWEIANDLNSNFHGSLLSQDGTLQQLNKEGRGWGADTLDIFQDANTA